MIHQIKEIQPKDRVLLVCVVSWRDRKGNLIDQENTLRDAVQKAQGVVVGVEHFIGQRYSSDWLWEVLGKWQKQTDWVLFETTDRILRHPNFKANRKGFNNLEPLPKQWLRLHERTQPFRLMTLLHPSSTPQEIRSFQRIRGQTQKQNKGGRPKNRGHKKTRKRTHAEHAVQLREQGVSVGKISIRLNVPKSTVYTWLKQASENRAKMSGAIRWTG